MVTLENRAPENMNSIEQQPETMEKEVSEYELCREERIRENRERMQKLGIFYLSQKLRPTPKRPYHRKNPLTNSPLPPSGPVRRSSRLHNSTPVSYCEVDVARNEKSSKDYDILREEGSRPEVYSEEHEKLLGSTEMSWTLFVDGYGKDGKRIYDPVKGKTCHQCRQKTLGHRTHCSKCNMVQGQFCGDCLYMRYGENVVEAKENPNWICPVCRGICNCSLCRNAKGWPPTGVLYKKISSLGFKSVAHYLIQTRRSKTDSGTNVGSKPPISAKRSLPFPDIELGEDNPSPESLNPDPLSVSNKEFGVAQDQVEYPLNPEPQQNGAGCDKAEFLVDKSSSVELKTVTELVKATRESSNVPLIDEYKDHHKDKPETIEFKKEMDVGAVENSPKSTKKRVRWEPTPDSIAGRLRQRRAVRVL